MSEVIYQIGDHIILRSKGNMQFSNIDIRGIISGRELQHSGFFRYEIDYSFHKKEYDTIYQGLISIVYAFEDEIKIDVEYYRDRKISGLLDEN